MHIQIFDMKKKSRGLVDVIKYVGSHNDDYINCDLIIYYIVII